MTERWTLFGFFQDQGAANALLKLVRRQGHCRTEALRVSGEGYVAAPMQLAGDKQPFRYRRRLVRNEALVIIQTRSQDLVAVLELLRHSAGTPIITFAFHPDHAYALSPDEGMLRRSPLTAEDLRLAAGRLAAAFRPAEPQAKRSRTLLRRLLDCERDITHVQGILADTARTGQPVSMSAQWLLDNAALLQEPIDNLRRNLPRRFLSELPVFSDGPYAGFPRVYGIAAELIADTDTRLDRDRICSFLQAFQDASPLTIGELWAVPLMLRLRLIECVRLLAIQAERREREREQADFWANRLLTAARRDPDRLPSFVASLAKDLPHPSAHLAGQLVDYLYDEETALSAISHWLEAGLGSPLVTAVQQESLN